MPNDLLPELAADCSDPEQSESARTWMCVKPRKVVVGTSNVPEGNTSAFSRFPSSRRAMALSRNRLQLLCFTRNHRCFVRSEHELAGKCRSKQRDRRHAERCRIPEA